MSLKNLSPEEKKRLRRKGRIRPVWWVRCILGAIPWSKQQEIPGVIHMGVARRKPGSVDLFFSLDRDTDVNMVYEKISRSMEAEKGLNFECRAILLKAVKIGIISGG
ncbi:hypothetical protein L9W92_02250 [Pelotomaculum terephthalicicum JT]|uniref:hypothetical protein n=1 Tax=Pelotomaculum TaxID=191373 RepID=UPI0009CAAF99|nr:MULTISPECIES: hypothetical protein [Pelotomaculum]MCG9966880.1 hypothetical protein [Pelotomaculum terephthalicicum JT]OPX87975.1 MAG: hypothetical protein A4E54_01417 [Pelotomaculum sp. PtaB.Bin117]OPY59000.1 MAG: hypothetical protein A4E56_03310 [Pelotomaculum sp. PtaU1.Bin065]